MATFTGRAAEKGLSLLKVNTEVRAVTRRLNSYRLNT